MEYNQRLGTLNCFMTDTVHNYNYIHTHVHAVLKTAIYSIRQKKLSRPYRLNAVETVARVPCFLRERTV